MCYNYPIEVAIDRACKDCIEEDVLSDILLSQRAEVMKMCITEFNEKAYVESVKQEAFDIFKEQLSQKDEQIAQLLARIKELESK